MGHGLDHPGCGSPEDRGLGEQEGQKERNRSADHEPLGGEAVSGGTLGVRHHGPEAGQREGGGQHRTGADREVEQRVGAGAGNDHGDRAPGQGEVPEKPADRGHPAVADLKPAELGEQPEVDREQGVAGPSVDEGVARGGLQAAVGEPLAGPKPGGQGLEGRQQREHRGQRQPQGGRTEQEEEGGAQRGVDPRQAGTVLVRAAGSLFLSHWKRVHLMPSSAVFQGAVRPEAASRTALTWATVTAEALLPKL